MCEKYDFIPTYLVTYKVADDEESVHILKEFLKAGKCEIGAHLHPWTTPPILGIKNNFIEKSFPNELGDEDLWHKLKNLTEKIKSSFEIQPISFRAGRWGFDKRMVEYLSKLGYKADCSITPKISWKNFKGKEKGIGGPDFRRENTFPRFLSNNKKENINSKNNLLEIPMSIFYTGILNKELGLVNKYFSTMPRGLIKDILNKLFFRLKWCRIFPETELKDLKDVYKSALQNNSPVLEFMIHSSELMVGGSPYSKKKENLENIYYILEIFFKYLKSQNIQGVTISDFLALYNKI